MGTNFAVAPGEYLQEWIDGNGRASAMLRKRVMPMQLEERFHAPIRRLSKKSLISCDPQDMRFAAFSERKGRLIWPIGLKPYIS